MQPLFGSRPCCARHVPAGSWFQPPDVFWEVVAATVALPAAGGALWPVTATPKFQSTRPTAWHSLQKLLLGPLGLLTALLGLARPGPACRPSSTSWGGPSGEPGRARRFPCSLAPRGSRQARQVTVGPGAASDLLAITASARWPAGPGPLPGLRGARSLAAEGALFRVLTCPASSHSEGSGHFLLGVRGQRREPRAAEAPPARPPSSPRSRPAAAPLGSQRGAGGFPAGQVASPG